MTYNGMHNPAAPGELLREFMGSMTTVDLAAHIGVSRATISRVLNGHHGVTAELSIKLGQAFRVSEDLFATLQLKRDMWVASQAKAKRIKPLPLAS